MIKKCFNPSLVHFLLFLALLLMVQPLLAQEERVSYVPSLDYKSFLVKKAVKSSQKRNRVVNILKNLLKQYPSGHDRAQLRIRLAQLYLDKARHIYFLELYKSDPQAEKLLKQELSIHRKDGKAVKLNSSYAYNRAAINIYRDILKKYPKLPSRDEVTFYLAYNLGEVGKNREAIGLYRTLIRKYPKSPYVPEAYLVQGEYYFHTKDMARALHFYKRVLKYPDGPAHDLARYKISWCHFNLGRIQLALKHMENLISRTGGSRISIDLREEALRDLVVIFSYGGYYKEAPFFFKQVGSDGQYRPMLKQLANLYYKQGKNSYASALYKRLIREKPSDKENPEFQNRLVEVAKRLGRKEDVITEANKLVRFYSDESRWSTKNKNDWNALQQAKELSEKTLRSVALSLHNEAQKTRDDRTYALAMASYREYLDNFPQTKVASKIRFYYAESLFKLKRYEQAGIEYSKVLTQEPKGPFGLKAAYGAIVSYDELVKKNPKKKKKTIGKKKEPQFIPIWQREMVRVSDNFIKFFARDRRSPQIAFNSARVFYDHNHFKEAVRRFDLVVTQYPKSGTTTFAANLVLDSWNIQERWGQVVKWGKKYYRDANLPGGKFKRDLFNIIEKASFKVSRSLEESGRHREAALKYIEFANEFKRSRFVDDALNNAAVSYRKGRDIDQSLTVYKRLIKQFPRSPFVERALLAIGKANEDLAMFTTAAKYYEMYQKRYPKAKEASDLIYNAGLFRENLEQYRQAITDYQIYVAKYRRKKDAPLVNFAIGQILEKQKRWSAAAAHYQRVASIYRKKPDFYLSALAKQGNALRKARAYSKATAVHQRVVAAARRYSRKSLAEDTIDLVAESHFHIVRVQLAAYRRVRLNVPLNRFESTIKRKTRMLDSLIKSYERIINYGAPKWVTASIYNLGRAYDNFAARLSEVKAPAVLDAATRSGFEKQIQSFVINMNKKAAEAYTACLDRASDLEVFTDVIDKAENRLADLTAKGKVEVREQLHAPNQLEDAIGNSKVL